MPVRLEDPGGGDGQCQSTGVGSASVVWDPTGHGTGFALHLNAEGSQRGLQTEKE